MLRRALAGLAALTALSALAGCGDDSSTATDPASGGSSTTPTTSDSPSATGVSCDYPTDPNGAVKKADPPPSAATVSGKISATIATNLGDLKVTLDADSAPCTVGSFTSLATQGYFDKTPCHRLVTQGIYVLQCGDPGGTGTGGPGYTIPDEYTGTETYGPGVLAMANTGQPNSGGSQFFIVYADSTAGLGKTYTVFGQLDAASTKLVADAAKAGTTNGGPDGPPKKAVTISGVTTG